MERPLGGYDDGKDSPRVQCGECGGETVCVGGKVFPGNGFDQKIGEFSVSRESKKTGKFNEKFGRKTGHEPSSKVEREP